MIDYSTIQPCACKCESIEQRDEILRQLNEWGVPISSLCNSIVHKEDKDPGLWLEYNYIVNQIYVSGDSEYRDNVLSTSSFLNLFREVYEAANYWHDTNKGNDSYAVPVAAKVSEIQFPSITDIAKIEQQAHLGCWSFNNIIDAYKAKVQELNKDRV